MATITDKTAPKLVSSTPKAGSVAIATTANLALTFNEPIKVGIGTIIITDGTDSHKIVITDKKQVSVSGSQITLNPTTDLLAGHHYSVTIPTTAIKDLAGNKYAGISNNATLSFDTAAATPPFLVSSTPSANSTGLKINQNLVLTFNEIVKAGRGDIVISNGSDIRRIAISDKSQITFNNKTVTINPSDDLLANSDYTVLFSADVIKNKANISFLNAPLPFTTQDLAPPQLVSSTPAEGDIIDNTSNLVLTFDEKVQAGSGNIVITNNNDDTRTISIADKTQVTIANNVVTINPTADLNSNSPYVLEFNNGVVQDLSGNKFVSVDGATALNFTALSKPITGKVSDGYLSGATITLTDSAGNIYTQISDAQGNFTFPAGTPNGVLMAVGGTDLSTGQPFQGVLKAPAGSVMITPLTTLQESFIEKENITAAQAEKLVATALGFDATKIDLQNYDPTVALLKADITGVAADKTAATKMLAITAEVSNFLVTAGEILQSAVDYTETTIGNLSAKVANDALVNALVTAIETDIKTGDGVIDLANPALLKTVFTQAATLAAANSIGKNDTSFTTNISKITDTVVTVLKDAADNVAAAVNNGGSASTLLTNIDKVSAFTQNTIGGSVLQNMTTSDALSAFTGTTADNSIAALSVTPLSGVASKNDLIAQILADAATAKAATDAKVAAAKAISDAAAAKAISDAAAAKAISDAAAAKAASDAAAAKAVLDAAAAKAISDAAAAKAISDAAAAKAISDAAAAKAISDAAAAKAISDAAAAKAISDAAAAKAISDAAAAKAVSDAAAAKAASDAAAAKAASDAAAAKAASDAAAAKTASDAAAAKAITDKATADAAAILAAAQTAAATQAASAAAAAKVASDAAAVAAAKLISDAQALAAATLAAAADTTPPTLALSTPADNATGVVINNNIVMTFSENIKIGSGNIVIASTSDTRTISVSDTSQVSISGNSVTINPTADLNEGVNYNVTLASGVIKDLAGNNFAGISDATVLNFTTLITPIGTVNNETSGADIINANQGDVTGTAKAFTATSSDQYVIQAALVNGALSSANITIANFSATNKLVFNVNESTTHVGVTADFVIVDSLYNIADNGTDVSLFTNDGNGNVQYITLLGISHAGVTIDNITQLNTVLGNNAVTFI